MRCGEGSRGRALHSLLRVAKAIKALKSLRHTEHQERHCPEPRLRCLVPLPEMYRRAAPWPRSRDMSPEMVNDELVVGKDDLVNLWKLVEGRDNGPAWIKMMEKLLPTMTYQAWRRDAPTGSPQYQSSTIFENATPEEVRNFFGDDEFRTSNKWDDMLIYHKMLEECQTTGTMEVHWVRKFPFFCSDREYKIGHRIWKLGGAYYCVTKARLLRSLHRCKMSGSRTDLGKVMGIMEGFHRDIGTTSSQETTRHNATLSVPLQRSLTRPDVQRANSVLLAVPMVWKCYSISGTLLIHVVWKSEQKLRWSQ